MRPVAPVASYGASKRLCLRAPGLRWTCGFMQHRYGPPRPAIAPLLHRRNRRPRRLCCICRLCLQGFSPVRPVTPGIAPRFPAIAPGVGFRFKAPYSPAIAFFPSKTMFGISRKRKRPISDCGAFLEGFALGSPAPRLKPRPAPFFANLKALPPELKAPAPPRFLPRCGRGKWCGLRQR